MLILAAILAAHGPARSQQPASPPEPPLRREAHPPMNRAVAVANGRFAAGFDGDATSWTVRYDRQTVRLVGHRRHSREFVKGGASEYILCEAGPAGGLVRLEHPLPPAQAIDDLTLSVWVRSNRSGITPALQLVLPNHVDPATGEMLTTFVPAEPSTTPGQWQKLQCTVKERQVRERLVLLRARLNDPSLDARGAYVDRVLLAVELPPGPTELFIDELECGPIVGPRSAVEPAAATRDEPARDGPPVDFRLDRLHVNGKPFFPRLAAWHEEPLEALRDAGLNVVWVPGYDDAALLGELRALGLWGAATPPRATDAGGEVLDPRRADMVPFSPATAPILFWNLGTRIPADAKDEVAGWVEQVRNADRQFNRPVMIDVSGLERVYSRQVPMLGVSRHCVHTSFSFRSYRDWLIQKRKLARPGSFVWSWIQTEPAPVLAEARTAASQPPMMVEPEQLRLQVYAALAGGCRGLGYWKTGRLDSDLPGASECRLALTQLNLELELLEPWLATGNVVAHVPFEATMKKMPRLGQRALDFRASEPERIERDALLRARDDDLKREELLKTELEATIIRSDYGLLLLPVWYETNSQFVPGQMVAADATIIVPGVDESATVWEVTPTGLHSLHRERVAGGTKIVLPRLDQTAAIVITADRKVLDEMRETILRIGAPSAGTAVQLAREKLERVRLVDQELQSLGLQQADSAQLFARSAALLNEAETALAKQDFHNARILSNDALQPVRILQRAHWSDAVRNLSTPLASPHTLCFQTLPNHWQLVSDLGRSPLNGVNLLRSGDFEDVDTMVVEGWKHSRRPIEGIRSSAELYPAAQQGKYSLRLVAMAETGEGVVPPAVAPEAPVIVSTPPVTVRAGQIVHISGWVRVVTPITASLDGVMLYDSLIGTSGAIRWREAGAWQKFELLREVQESGPMTLTVALTGLGEVQLDDIRIVPHAPRDEPVSPELNAGAPKGTSGPLNFLKSLPRIPRLAPRRSGYAPELQMATEPRERE